MSESDCLSTVRQLEEAFALMCLYVCPLSVSWRRRLRRCVCRSDSLSIHCPSAGGGVRSDVSVCLTLCLSTVRQLEEAFALIICMSESDSLFSWRRRLR